MSNTKEEKVRVETEANEGHEGHGHNGKGKRSCRDNIRRPVNTFVKVFAFLKGYEIDRIPEDREEVENETHQTVRETIGLFGSSFRSISLRGNELSHVPPRCLFSGVRKGGSSPGLHWTSSVQRRDAVVSGLICIADMLRAWHLTPSRNQ